MILINRPSYFSFPRHIIIIIIVSISADWIRSLQRRRYRGQFRACSNPTTYLLLYYSCLHLFWNVNALTVQPDFVCFAGDVERSTINSCFGMSTLCLLHNRPGWCVNRNLETTLSSTRTKKVDFRFAWQLEI